MADFLRRLISQDRAIANAREGATIAAKRRVERVEVDLYLAALAERRASRTA
ncbi:MAG TPA: hypothetical protein VFK41_08620 [Nocardioidaceae bacterium]|nr:hypothetical protein [Nocardioidaceae bacterium]